MATHATLPSIDFNLLPLPTPSFLAKPSFDKEALSSDKIRSAQESSSGIAQLAEEHLPLVRSVARRIHRTLPRHVELDDLISAGYVGLLDAAERFQASRQTTFRSFAEFRVRGAILDSLRNLDWGSRTLRKKAKDIEATRASLSLSFGRAAEDVEVATDLSITVTELRRALDEVRSLAMESLQAERQDGEGLDLLSTLADPQAKDALTLCLEGEFKQALIDAIEALPERERLVITLSYYEELTLKEVGEVLNVTESRVSQLRSSAVRRLRQALEAAR